MLTNLNPQERMDLLERFLRYVRVDTQSDDNSTTFPSTEKQKDLSRILVQELLALGCTDARMDDFGYVYATVEANPPDLAEYVPTIGLIAHVDTATACSGKDVKPQVIERYQGGDIPLPGNPEVVLMESENPNLGRCIGHTLITTDGTTLLGADDKAGVAEIMTAVAWMRRHPEFKHGRVRVAFTPDEEVGRGTQHFDVPGFGAKYAYTLDGSDLGEIEDETFCANSAKVVIDGKDVHPGYAKGKMVNALRVATALVQSLPADRFPETTDGREPYLHAYDIKGGVTQAEIKLLVRAFTVEELAEREEVLRQAAAQAQQAFPGSRVTVEVKEQYRNMGYELKNHPLIMDYAFEAARRMGIEPVRKAIRGGTDGSRLTFMGLPTPNLWAGGQNFHSLQEWASLDWMGKSVEFTLQLLGVWVEKSAR
jgi:tripeptide aminopeptidase